MATGEQNESKNQRRYLRVAILALVPLLAIAGPLIWASQVSIASMFNAPLQWVDSDTPALREFNQFVDHFESVEFVLVSWPGCTVDDPRLEQVAEAIKTESKRREQAGQPRLVDQVITGYSMLRGLMSDPPGLSRGAALHRIVGTFVGKDGETSCAVIALSETGSWRRRETITQVIATVLDATGLSRDELYVSGPPVDGLAIDDESIRSMRRYSFPAIALSFVLCCLCLRSVWLTLPILLIGSLGQAASLAVIYMMGYAMNAVLIVLPPLIFVLTVSAGVHIVNYYYEEENSDQGNDGAIGRAMRKAKGPCVMAAITTAIGLASLMVSDIQPVRQFGGLAAAGVLMAVLLLFALIPGAIEVRRRIRRRRFDSNSPNVPPPSLPKKGISQAAGEAVWRWSSWITITCFALLAFCGIGLMWLQSSINVVALLEPQNRAVQDFRWFEKNLGPLVPVEVVIHFAADCTLDPLERLELIRTAHGRIGKIDEIGGVTSAATFFPNIPPQGSLRNTARRAVLRRQIQQNEDQLVRGRYLSIVDGSESWRISGRVFGLENFDYNQFLDQLRDRVTPLIASFDPSQSGAITATYTGVTAVVYEVEMSLLVDLFDSFVIALVMITIIMVFALKSLQAGLIAMVPNIFPTLIMFGTMGWIAQTVDIGTVMTASVALGIAVDGTFHFMKWFCHEVEIKHDRLAAIQYAYRHCGLALIQTTVICGCGLLVFGLSGFLPARFFAVHLFLLLVAALVGDLVVLPALLAGPLGKVFDRPHHNVTTES